MKSIREITCLFGAAVVLMLPTSMGLSQKALGFDDHHGFDDHRREEEEMRRRDEERRRWAMEHPMHHEVFAPAPVVYAPPPPSPGISIVLPINFH